MADNIKKNANGEDAMAYNLTGGKPWHHKGNPVNGDLTDEEIERVMPFEYFHEPLYVKRNGVYQEVQTHDAITIDDTNTIMGVGGRTVSIYQPKDCAKFIRALSDEGVRVETVGALGKGERIWFLMHEPKGKFEVFKGDETRMYILVTNAYDFTAALEARYTGIRAVCENTVNAAVKGAPACVKIKHTANMHQRAAEAAEIFKGYVRANATFKEAMQYLAKHPVNDKLIREFEDSMFGELNKTEEGRAQTILKNKREKFEELVLHGRGTEIKGVVGSAYGMFNAYTEYQDWHSTVRNAKTDDGDVDRTNSILFGQASKLKSKALEVALVLTGR